MTETFRPVEALSARRILVSGGPRTGKTSLGKSLLAMCQEKTRLRSTDDLIGQLEWSEASQEVSKWMCEPGPWIIEGVAVERALRKWLAANGTTLPFDLWIVLLDPIVPLSSRQSAMSKACETIRGPVLSEVNARLKRLSTAPRVLLRTLSANIDRHLETALEPMVVAEHGPDKPQRAAPIAAVTPPKGLKLRTRPSMEHCGDPLDRVRGSW